MDDVGFAGASLPAWRLSLALALLYIYIYIYIYIYTHRSIYLFIFNILFDHFMMFSLFFWLCQAESIIQVPFLLLV